MAVKLAVILVLVGRLLFASRKCASLTPLPLILKQFQIVTNRTWVDTCGNKQCRSTSDIGVAKRVQSFFLLEAALINAFINQTFSVNPSSLLYPSGASKIDSDRSNVRSIILRLRHARNHTFALTTRQHHHDICMYGLQAPSVVITEVNGR